MITILTALAGGHAITVDAQVLQPWGDPAPRGVLLDVFRPTFDGGGTSTLTTINQVGVRWAVGRAVLVGELPIVFAKADGAPSGGTLIGNPFLGVATDPASPIIGEFGVRIPVVSVSTAEREFAQEVAVLGDFADFEAYAEDLLTVRGTVGYRYRTPEHLALRAALRPTLMTPTGSNTGDSELFLDYAAQAGYETNQFTLGVMFNGRAWITQPGMNFGERTVHELGLGGSVILGQWRPGAIVRVPLDSDLSNVVNASFGLKLEVTF